MRGNYMQLLIFDLKPIMMDEFGLLHSQQKTPGTCDLYIYIYTIWLFNIAMENHHF